MSSSAAAVHTYHVYGFRVRSAWPLPGFARSAACLAELGLVRGSASRFARAVVEARAIRPDERTWLRGVLLDDGQTYLRWSKRFEFLVSADGRAIAARPLAPGSREAFHVYLLGQALSFALLKQGFDPLHATAVTIDGAAVAFLGDTGYGKSTLAAAFLQSGHPLLTDDLLVLSSGGDGFVAHPGPARIKLFPEIARKLLGPHARGALVAKTTPKRVIPLPPDRANASAAPLQAIYVLSTPDTRSTSVAIRRVSKRQACLALLRNAFNTAVTDPQRLSRQFAFAWNVASRVPIKRISYPRTIGSLASVRDAILADVSRN